jgi:hypothetical protein
LVVALAALAMVAGACFGRGEPPPDVVERYLSALRDGDLRAAYDLTTFDRSPAVPGFALTFEHFAGFYERTPVRDAKVVAVFPQQITERTGVQGESFWTIDLDVRFDFGVTRQTVFVQGSVPSLHRIEVEPVPITFTVTDGFPTMVLVDGVATPISNEGERTGLTVLRGEHELVIGTATITVATDPLGVVSGPASLDEGPPPSITLAA